MTDTALICGAGGALGTALVMTFLDRGDLVVACDRHGAPSAGDPEGLARRAVDLTRSEEVEALWDSLPERPRWVVNAAGGFRGGTVEESDPDAFEFVEKLNLGTAWWSCRAAARRLGEGDAIVNVASRSARIGGAGSAAYSVAKAGVVRLTEVLAAELKEKRVRVNAVLPSVIDTPANRGSMPPGLMAKAVPAEQIATVVAFLCSDGAAAITGASLPVYGWA